MKKLLVTIIILLVPFVVNADEAPPEIRYLYEVKIAKDGGSDCLLGRNNIHVDQNEIVKVYGETKEKGVDYLLVILKDETMCQIPKEDTALISDVVDPKDTDAEKIDEKNTFLILEDGVEVLKGPSSSYDVIKTLKKGVYDKITYANDGSYNSDSYIYVEVDDIKGWINISKYDVYVPYYKFILGINSHSSCAFVPANTIIENAWYRIKANKAVEGVDGSTGYKTSETKIVFKYENCINEFEDFNTVNSMVNLISDKVTMTTKSEIELYKDKSNKKVLMKIPKGEKVTRITEAGSGNMTLPSMYVEYKGTKGWVMKGSFEEFVLNDSSNYIDAIVDKDIFSDNEVNKKDDEDKEAVDTKNIIIICLLCAICIALTAIIVIILVNRKKDKNEKNI